MNYFSALIPVAVMQLPYFIIDLIGIVLAVTRRHRHPKVSLLAGIYFASRFLLSIIGIGTTFLPLYLSNLGYSMTQYGMILGMIGFVNIGIGTILSIILLFAIFGWREERKPEIVTEQHSL